MSEQDDRQAVLYALETANDRARTGQRKSVSSERLFQVLPLALRNRWSLNYLRDVVLRDMIKLDLVEVQQVGPGELHYRPTERGEAYMLKTEFSDEELLSAA